MIFSRFDLFWKQEVIHSSYLNHGVLVIFAVIFFAERVINIWNSVPSTVNFSTSASFRRTIHNVDNRFFTVYEVQLTLMYFIFRVYGSYECHTLTFLSSFYLMLLSTCILLCANKHRWMDDLAVFRRYKSIIVTWHKHYIRFSTWFLFYFYICQ